MLNVSTAFKKKLYNDERDYINSLRFTLADGTVLNVTHEHIMENGIQLEDAVGDDNKFNALGATVCNSLEITLYNNDEIYSDYVFENAKCIYKLSMQLDESTVEPPFQKGVYTVDEATYSDYTITLKMLDNMEQFDRPYNSTLTYPATLREIVSNACVDCNVNLATTSLRFPHDDYVVSTKPSANDTTYRAVLGWCATIAGCYARCNTNGELEFKWFDTSVLEDDSNDFDGGVFDSANPYATGANVEGGSFNPWNTGDEAVSDDFTTVIPYHYITDLVTQNLGVDDIVITGVNIVIKIDDPQSNTDMAAYGVGTSDYMIQVTDNPFITIDTVEDVLNWLSTQLIGLTFRQCNVTHPNDPTIEAGDVGILWDKNGVQHNVLITRVTFSPLAYQTVVCGAESISKNQATRITESTKTFIETRKQLRKQKFIYDDAIADLQDDIANSNGLYTTEVVQQDQSVKIYYHNKPLLAESDIQMLFSTTGFTVTANGTDANPTWYGLTVDGQFLASVINTISLFFNYAHGGTLTLGGQDNVSGVLRVLDANGNQVCLLNRTGVNATAGDIAGWKFNKKCFYKRSSVTEGTPSIIYEAQMRALRNDNSNPIDSTYAFRVLTVNYNGGDPNSNSSYSVNEEKFYVTYGGKLFAKNAEIEGKVTTESGRIANFDIEADKLYYKATSSSYPVVIYEGNSSFSNYHTVYTGKYGVQSYSSNSSTQRGVALIDGAITFFDRNASETASIYGYSNRVNVPGASFFSTSDSHFYTGVQSDEDIWAAGDIDCGGQKHRTVTTKDYGQRHLNSYETTTPMFGDVGEATINDDGVCYVVIDPIFSETVTLDNYQVFLQKEGEGDCFIKEKRTDYFVIQGTPNLHFAWEIKARQLDFRNYRLAKKEGKVNIVNSVDFANLANEHINALNKGRILA